jgi:t-SNARE complex subunit (syntaxin)
MSTTSKLMKLATGAIKFLPEAQWAGIVVELLSQLASSMGVTSGDSKEALKHIESLRSDLGQITTAHAGLLQQFTTQSVDLAAQTEKLDTLSAELHLTKLAVANVEFRLTRSEIRSARTATLALISCGLTTIVIILLIVVLLHQH